MRTNIEIDDRLMREAMRSSASGPSGRGRSWASATGSDTSAGEDTAVAGEDPVAGQPARLAARARVQVGRDVVIVDTTVWIAYLGGVQNAEAELVGTVKLTANGWFDGPDSMRGFASIRMTPHLAEFCANSAGSRFSRQEAQG